MACESFASVRFDLLPLLQGQMGSSFKKGLVSPLLLLLWLENVMQDSAEIVSCVSSVFQLCIILPSPTFLLKECLDILLPSITKLVNCSLTEGAVPAGFKKAIVSPLIKKSSLPPDELKNYRPVSGLNFISKLVERVVVSQLNDHVTSNGLENVSQSAYKQGHSTETALLSIKNEVHLALARGEATAVVLLDQSAAFDTIDHSTLMECLSSWFGVGGVVLDWFRSYLSDRYQCIKIGSVLSDAKRLLYGVPQGSVLGPILFSLYTTPLSKVIQNHPGIHFHFYADDTQLYVHLTHKHATLGFERLKNCLDDVRKWFSVNKLKLNPDKTEFILFGSKNVRTKLGKFFPVNILGTLLSPAEAIRNLGVWFDSDFSFSCHVRNICKACFVHIRDLRRLRGYLTREAALLAANALVGSRLDYCNSLFRSLSALDLRRLQCVQNSLARIVANTTKYSHITPVRKSLHWLPIMHRSIFKVALLCKSFYIVAIQNTSNLSLNLDTVCTERVEVNLRVFCLRSHILHQYTSQKSNLALVLHTMLR